ncbi:hypothetical protein COCMIDRAFT_6294 [Bipolaris oryzae ATCC 44560]|uniref:Uncharacterized protein n=1 Tax=Bipolaris oryzae ATCC 44560 TaxID=930090 RepID=W6ZLF8_COCMI|nr:uncharacterized protein COCMIDRAFT_6294 [Bipolaris oryzae ATCC 44560]EUC44416.1 hypothetical protein COCMIDRAFT_6294 [Bipolaris oryzae ATCC 44560]
MRRLLGKFKTQVEKSPEAESSESKSSTNRPQTPLTNRKASSLPVAQTSYSPHSESALASSTFDTLEESIRRPGNGYNPEAEAAWAEWISRNQGDGPCDSGSAVRAACRVLAESAKPNPANTELRKWRREQLGLAPGDDPEWDMDETDQRELEQSYADAYRVPEDPAVRTAVDIINMTLEKLDVNLKHGKHTEIPT